MTGRDRWSLVLVLGMSAACSSSDGSMSPNAEPIINGANTGTAGSAAVAPPTVPGAVPPGVQPPPPNSGGIAGTAAPVPPSPVDMMPKPMGNGKAVDIADTIEGPIPRDCQGIVFKDIKYSPGGTALPNVCAPYDATKNNPYAVRCIDAWPKYKTKYAGDEFCILPPPPDKGLQYGFHPQGDDETWLNAMVAGDLSGYENLVGQWVLSPGAESNTTYIGGSNNPQAGNYYRTLIRMRAGSHHMINSIAADNAVRGTWGMSGGQGLSAGDQSLPSIQRTDENWPSSLEQPVEDKGLYRIFPAHPNIAFNVHHFNGTDQDMLKETWTNIWWEPNGTRKVHFIETVPTSQIFKLNVGPNTTLDLHYSYSFTTPIRVLELFGHRHSWTPNFSAWAVRASGQTELVYQSFDWHEIPTYRYDSLTQNPMPVTEKKIDGATSGMLTMNPGDKLHFNCHIAFTDERAAEVNNPPSTEVGSLGFANEAQNAEMCILFGWSADTDFGQPAEETGPLPDFATYD